jgi:hypothetical protein
MADDTAAGSNTVTPVNVVPGGGQTTVGAGGPRAIICLYFSDPEVLCGDEAHLDAIVGAPQSTDTLNVSFQAADGGSEIDSASPPLDGVTHVITTNWIAKKPKDVWSDDPDVKAVGKLLDSGGNALSTEESAPSLKIIRPECYEATMRQPSRTTPKWVDSSGTGAGPWVKQADNWQFPCGFDVTIKEGVITATCKINLAPQGGLVITNAMKSSWKNEIEGYWNNVFAAHRKKCKRGKNCDCNNHCCKFDIKIVCSFVASGQHTTVDVHPGACTGPWGSASWWYSTTWWENKSANVPTSVRAHEFGHNMGLFDEYKGGATAPSVDPNHFTEPTASIMNGGNSPMIWHFMEHLAVLARKTKDPYVTVKAKK